MKRWLSIALIVVLCLCIYSTAEENTSTEILFRGIPWGISIREVREQFGPVRWSSLKKDKAYEVEWETMGKKSRFYDGYVQCRTSLNSPENINVAGYEVDSVTLWGAFTTGDDGFLVQDIEHTKFFQACYHLKPKDLLDAKADLISKLTTLYGEPEYMYAAYSYTESYAVWHGSNNTFVSLETDLYMWDLNIWYGTLDGNQYFQEALDALKAEEKANAIGNFSGL